MNIDQFIESRSPGMRWLIAIFIWGAFILGTILIKNYTGSSAGILLIIPTIILSWYFGFWKGLILAFGGFFIYFLVGIMQGGDVFRQTMVNGGLAGILTSILISGLVGKIGVIARSQRKDILDRDQAVEQSKAQTRFLSLLNDIVQASLGAHDRTGMLNILVSRTGELFHADDCFITFWDEKNRLSIPMAAYGPSSETYRSVVAKPGELTLTASVLEAGHALVVENPRNSPFVDPEVVAPFPDIQSSLVLPLISNEMKLGAILLSFRSPRKFSVEEVAWGELAARQVSLALTKILLLEESNKRVQELTGLYQISRTLHLPDVSRNIFGQLTETMAQLVDAQICIIGLKEPEKKEIVARVSAYGLDDDLVQTLHYPIDQGARTWDFSDNGIFCINSINDIPEGFLEFARLLNIESVMAAPMWSTDQDLFGMVFAINKPAGFDADDVRMLGVFAAQASFVIQNIQLFDLEHRRNEELSVLNAISKAATDANDEDELIEFVTRMIGEKLYPDNFGILMLDDSGEHLNLHTSYRLGEQEIPIKIPVGVGITGDVVLKGKARRVNDITQAADYLSVDDRISSELCVPLKIEERVIGVANAESAKLNAFTQRDEDLLNIIAGQLASAIERLRTAQAQYKQTTELARSNAMIRVLAQVGSRASLSVNPEGVMHTLGDELSKLGLMCVIALPGQGDRNMYIAYTSIPDRVVRMIEKAAGRKIGEFVFSRDRFWLNSQESMEPLLLNDPVEVVCNILVDFPRQNIQRLLSPIGVTPDVPICHLPLIVDNEFKGVFWLWGEGLRTTDMPTMSIFGSQVAVALQNAHLLAKVQKMAVTDDLTRIFNRGHFFEVAEREFSQARRYGLPLSAIILDIDHFKKFNDVHGHIVGDQVLRNVAQVLKNNLRDNDTLGRYGGEEFSILMPITELEAAYQVALRLKTCVAGSSVATDTGPVGVKISVGVSQLAEDMTTLLNLINRADQAMYIAKSTGGNSVAVK